MMTYSLRSLSSTSNQIRPSEPSSLLPSAMDTTNGTEETALVPLSWPTFSVHAAAHNTSIPLHAYIHLPDRLQPYKRVLKSTKRLSTVSVPIDLSALRTVDELDYLPSNRNLAIRQTLAHYFSSYLPSVLGSKFSAIRPNSSSPSSSPSSQTPSSSSAHISSPPSSTPSHRSFDSDTPHCLSDGTSSGFSEYVNVEIPSPPSSIQAGLIGPTSDHSSHFTGKQSSTSGLKALRGNVVILGGFRGSVLQQTNSKGKAPRVLWPNVHEAIFKRDTDPDLAMLLSADEAYGGSEYTGGESRMVDLSNGIESGSMLDRIGVSNSLPPVLDLGFSLGRRLEQLNKRRKNDPDSWVQVEQWGYDFRADLEETTDELLKFLTKLKASARDGQGATVFAHSMGGLVLLNAISKAEDLSLFKQVVFFGTPFQGCPGIFSPFRYGDGFFRQVNLCNPYTSSSWPSSFYLLPHRSSFFTPDGKPIELDLSNIKTWDKYGLSPLAAGVSDSCERGLTGPATRRPSTLVEGLHPRLQDSVGMSPAPRNTGKKRKVEQERTKSSEALHPSNATPEMIRAHFERCIKRIESFRARLKTSHVPGKKYPPMAIVAANRVRTVKGTMISESKPEKFVEEGYKSLVFDWGDGVILWESAVGIPGGWGKEVTKVVESKFGHMTLLADHESIDEALKACGAELNKH